MSQIKDVLATTALGIGGTLLVALNIAFACLPVLFVLWLLEVVGIITVFN